MSNHLKQNLGCLGRLLQLLAEATGARAPDAGEPPFAAKDWLLSKAERSFLGVLDQAVATLPRTRQVRVMCKVRLLDVVYPRKGVASGSQHQTWRNKVDRKHLDFLLVTVDELRPIAAVELDDVSHRGRSAAERDAVKDRVLAAAGLPLIRIPARRTYNVEEVRAAITRAIQPVNDPQGATKLIG